METEDEIKKKTFLPEDIIEEINQKALQLNKIRKDNKKNTENQANLIPLDVISNFSLKKSESLHSTVKPGITSFDLHPDSQHILTGGLDGSVLLYD